MVLQELVTGQVMWGYSDSILDLCPNYEEGLQLIELFAVSIYGYIIYS